MHKYTYWGGFEWDEGKNEANRRKHRLDFETAREIFSGPILTWLDSRHDYGETRSGAIGRTDGMTLVVVFTDRRGNARIISARKANRHERKIYEEAIAAIERG